MRDGRREAASARAVIVGSLVAGIALVAAGEWIDLHLSLEENTRPRGGLATTDEDLRWVA